MTDNEPIRFLHIPDCSGSASCLYAIANTDGTVTIGDTDPAITSTVTVPRASWDSFIDQVRNT